MKDKREMKAFTLIELLIVVSVTSILAMIALPNYMEAQTRAKVSVARSDLRTISAALEVYAMDHHVYPPTRPVFPHDPLGVFAVDQLHVLTRPVDYLGGGGLVDPFGDVRRQGYFNQDDYRWQAVNPRRSYLYFNYVDLARSWEMPCLSLRGAAILSLGPDRVDSLGAYRPFSNDCFKLMYELDNLVIHPINTMYDPTNGTTSNGDVARFTGQAARFEEAGSQTAH